ncbi:MAG TPA: hypothetical protein VMP67_06405 [Candidatus Limnocylindria bacterium]|nr:hypothetical protein [Candidatus Limnocylindria bacterium]
MSVRVITNPAEDGAFRRSAEGLMAGGARSPMELQDGLRSDYPGVRVVSGITDRETERWYVYREGHWIRRAEFGPTS